MDAAALGSEDEQPWVPPMPQWSMLGEQEDHCVMISEFHTKMCPDFLQGFCAWHGAKGKSSQCFGCHFESQLRRPPINSVTGELLYWDVPCPAWHSEQGLCPNGDKCLFAHGRDEISFHPAKYKTRLCNGHDCRGEGVCCFAHNESELRRWAIERYSYAAVSGAIASSQGMLAGPSALGACASQADAAEAGESRQGQLAPWRPSYAGGGPGSGGGNCFAQKHRFCATFPTTSACRRGAACAFAHSREEVLTPLLSVEEEAHSPAALTEAFFTEKFKTLWCPIGAQHDWQTCVYAHTFQDSRRIPSIGYGPQPCPYWSKKDTRATYSQRCPVGLRCPYAHGAKEQLYHPKYFRSLVCRDLQSKGCPRKQLCAFHHRRAERRVPGPDGVDYNRPLSKEALPLDWQSRFLSPPFFQEQGEGDDSQQGGIQGMPMMQAAGPMMMMNVGASPGAMFWAYSVPGMPCIQEGALENSRPGRGQGGATKAMRGAPKGDRGEETPRTQSSTAAGESDGPSGCSLETPEAGTEEEGAWPANNMGFQGSYMGADSWNGVSMYYGQCCYPAFYSGRYNAQDEQGSWWPPEQDS